MEIKSSVLVPFLVGTILVMQTIAGPVLGDEGEAEITADKRPKYMDTRDLEDAFKSLMLSTIQQLVVDGKLSPEIIVPDEESNSPKAEKRGRQGLCWRRSNGKVRPFFCWRGNESAAKRGQQSLCYKKISSNRVLPYVCWKSNK